VDVRQLTYFVAIAEANTISDAAKKLNIAQSALSQMLKQLETELGTTLVERHKKQHHLTPSGRLMYDESLTIIAQINQAKQRIQDISVGISGSINIGVDPLLSNVLSATVKPFIKKNPEIKLNIFQNDLITLQTMLETREIDLALTHYSCIKDDFAAINRQTVPVYLVYPDNIDKHWTVNEILTQSATILLPLNKEECLYKELIHWLKDIIHVSGNITNCTDINLFLQLLKTKQYISFVPQFLLKDIPKSFQTQKITQTDLNYLYQWVYQKNRYLPEIMSDFLHFDLKKQSKMM